MDDLRTTSPSADGSDDLGFRARPAWLLVLAALLAAQALATAHLFGGDSPGAGLLDDRPLVTGRHPLHLYHGLIGARSWAERGTPSCFDPAFQAGYPKTPLFDGGSRPAELALRLAGEQLPPATAYKLLVAAVWTAVPLALALAARQLGLGPGLACVAAALGAAAGWLTPLRALLADGDLDLLLAALALLVLLTGFAGFHRRAAAGDWLGILGGTALGWYACPPWFAVIGPAVVLCHLAVLTRHGLAWHLAAGLAWAVGWSVNAVGLHEWAPTWWVRVPLWSDAARPAGPILDALLAWWQGPAWGVPAERIALATGLGLGSLGVIELARAGRPATAWLCGCGLFGCVAAGVADSLAPALRSLGLGRLFALAPWFAIGPALVALSAAAAGLGRIGTALLGGLAAAGLAALVAWHGPELRELLARIRPLTVGLDDERTAVTAVLQKHTSEAARVLWEDRPINQCEGGGWTALLPALTGRAFIGGIDPAGEIEHSFPRMAGGLLAGRPLARWSDDDLARYCRRYNVGWVAAWSRPAVARWRAHPAAREAARLRDGGEGVLFVLDRPAAFVLKGRARVVQADWRRVALADVEPEDGELVLSLHGQSGWRVVPAGPVVERDPDADDPVPMLRLRLAGPAACLMLVWDGP
jgi:hypothetical protein